MRKSTLLLGTVLVLCGFAVWLVHDMKTFTVRTKPKDTQPPTVTEEVHTPEAPQTDFELSETPVAEEPEEPAAPGQDD